MKKLVRTLVEFEKEATRFAEAIIKNKQSAVLVTLSGELGVGKTSFVKAVARTLGIKEIVNSPTFVLEKIYPLPNGRPFKRLVHIDAYRLLNKSELVALEFSERMRDTDNLILFEWPEKVASALPIPTTKVSFTVLPDGSRKISYA